MGAPKAFELRMKDGGVRRFKSRRAAAKEFGICEKKIHKRICVYGWTKEEAFEIVEREAREKPVQVTLGDGSRAFFDNMRQAARCLGVPYLVAYKRLQRGWLPEQAFNILPPPKRKSSSAKETVVELDGETLSWPSLTAAAEDNGITLSALKGRLKNGETLPEALGLTGSSRRSHKIRVVLTKNGSSQSFDSISAAARARNLSVDLVYQRLKKLNWSLEEALEICPRQDHTALCYGIVYLVTHLKTRQQYVGQTRLRNLEKRWQMHLAEAKKKANKAARPLIEAIKKHGEHAFGYEKVDDAMNLAELNAKEKLWIALLGTQQPDGFNVTRGGSGLMFGQEVAVGGLYFSTITAAAEYFGMPLTTASRWLSKVTPEQAFGLEERPSRRSQSRSQPLRFTYNRKKYFYPSKRAAAEVHGVGEKLLYRRLNDGWSPAEALNLTKRKARV